MGEVSSINRTPEEHSSACGTRTAAGDYQLHVHSHRPGCARMLVEEADGETAQVHRDALGSSDRQQSQGPGTYYSNTVGHLTALVGAAGKVESLAETERKNTARSALCRALAPGRAQPRLGGRLGTKRGNANLKHSGGHPVLNTQMVATLWILDATLLKKNLIKGLISRMVYRAKLTSGMSVFPGFLLFRSKFVLRNQLLQEACMISSSSACW